jgi:SPP1 family predicted phage head-tail adaptor
MTYDHELTLISQIITEDAIGNQVPVETETIILCNLKSVVRAEFYSAAAAGLKPEVVFVVHECEYNGEQLVEFEGKRYGVLRTYSGGRGREGYRLTVDEMELVCGKVAANG